MGPISAEVRSRFEALANVAIYPSITETRDR
jgi:hypothetical protein